MARNTRQRRRQRRRAQTRRAAAERRPARAQPPAAVRPAAQAPKTQTGSRRVPGGGFRRFVGESIAELKKVEWPSQSQVIQGTVVVIIACAIVGAYLWIADLVFKPSSRLLLK